jgi:hypothetical protein
VYNFESLGLALRDGFSGVWSLGKRRTLRERLHYEDYESGEPLIGAP